ncbi:MAG TPA: methyl-accepting chemotaxis protein [Pseudoduganella sp.]|jgi:methyl-accepting chemotaxis protein
MNLQNLKISTRLALGFGLLIALVMLLTVIGNGALRDLNHGTTEMAGEIWPRARAANFAIDNVRGSYGRLAQLVSASDPQVSAKAQEKLAKDIGEFNEGIAELDKLLATPEEKALQATTREKRDSYVAALSQAVALVKEGRRDEANTLAYGPLYSALKGLADALRAQVDFQEKHFDAKAAAAQQTYTLTQRMLWGAAAMAVLLGSAAAWLITTSIVRPLTRAVEVARTVASGDLTSHIDVHGRDETSQLMQAMKEMNGELLNIVTAVRTGTGEIDTASREIANGNLELSARTEQQASALEETASSMEEITSTVQQNAANAQQANDLAAAASGVARDGGAVVSRVVATMGEIDASSRRIVDIISVIDGIAFQTNILALNAAVEAARAGEQGRGFAVVASEVRNLAQRSAAAAKEIKQLIDTSVEKVSLGSKLVNEAGATMNNVVHGVQRVADIIGEISGASREQEVGITQINQAITEMDAVTQQNAALVEEAAGAAGSLQDQTARLMQLISTFRV